MKPKPDYYTVREESIPWDKKFETKEEAVKFARERRGMMTGMGQKGITVHAIRLKKGNGMQNYDITYKAFNGAWMTLTGRYMGRNKEEAIKIFKSKTPHGEIISIAKIDKYGMPTKSKKVGKGWHESPGADGKAPIHKKVAERAQAKHAQNKPMTREEVLKNLPENTKKELVGGILKGYYQRMIKKLKTEKIKIQQSGERTEWITERVALKDKWIAHYEKRLAEEEAKTAHGHFTIEEDRMGNITLSHSGSKRIAFFQAEADKEFIIDLLKKDEKEDLENGYDVKINDSEPRASALSELWEASGGEGD